MSATQTIITYLDDAKNADEWGYIAELSDPEGDGEYDNISVGIHARDVLKSRGFVGAFNTAVDWDAVGAWLAKSFRAVDESAE